MGREQFGAAVERILEEGESVIKQLAHPRILRALPGEEEGDLLLALTVRLADVQARPRLTRGELCQLSARLGDRLARERETMSKCAPSRARRVADVAQRDVPLSELIGVPVRQLSERDRSAGRQREQVG